MFRREIIAFTCLGASIFALGCGAARHPAVVFPAPAAVVADPARLDETVERFYGARDLVGLKSAVAEATALAPQAAATQEISARLARLEGRDDDAIAALFAALAQADNPVPIFHLNQLLDLPMTTSQYRHALALMESFVDRHPDPAMRRVAAAYVASWKRRLDADLPGAERALAARGAITTFAVASAFGNEEGKGFATEYPPEREIDFSAEYEGAELPARWRADVPLNHQHGLDLGALVSPSVDVVAYALSYVRVPQAGEYTLRLSTTDALRIWINDLPVLSEQNVDVESVDQFVVSVVLRAGWNKLLIKSCHGRGSWSLGVVLTDRQGELVPNLETSAAPQAVADGVAPGPGYDFGNDLTARLVGVGGQLRRLSLAIERARDVGLATATENLTEIYLDASRGSLLARLARARVARDLGQLGLTIDTCDALLEENQEAMPEVLLMEAKLLASQERTRQARELIQRALKLAPDYRAARDELANLYREEGWIEDALAQRLADAERWPDDTITLWSLASVYETLGRRDAARDVYERILDLWHGAQDIHDQMVELALDESDYRTAERHQRAICETFPNMPYCYARLGDIYRRAGRTADATAAYEQARRIDDRWSEPLERQAAIAWEAGDRETAIRLWRESLRLEPDDHSLADRLEAIAPQGGDLLSPHIPSLDEIRAIVAKGSAVEVFPGANTVFLLDHSVERIEADGSSRQVVTQVIRVINDTGRDQLQSFGFPPGRLELIQAFSVDPAGNRSEATNLRDGEVRFRDLKVGSTVVVQFRLDARAQGYLARHFTRRWFFHGVGGQFELSRYILIVPAEGPLHVNGHGGYTETRKVEGNRRILTFEKRHVAPLVLEPYAPAAVDLLDQVQVSSIPDWETIASWDAALLVDAFRASPELRAVAKELTDQAATPRAKLDALYRFVMREVRYQQDYENSIAGVKPHPASLVLQRRYGDCKDKSVLLMALLAEVGIESRFVILRTTGIGDFIKELPSLQFNHAIVYVPAQKELPQPLFLDATPDTLDLTALRPDDQGAWAMVIRPEGGFEWIRIEERPAAEHLSRRHTVIAPTLDGAPATVRIDFTFRGPAAAAMRGILRNPDEAKVVLGQIVGRIFPSAKLVSSQATGHEDIIQPVEIGLEIAAEVTRQQGGSLVVELPKTENISEYISLAERRLPLQTGIFLSRVESTDEVVLPAGHQVEHAPPDLSLDNRFFRFERKNAIQDGRFTTSVTFEDKMSRVPVADYAAYRELVSQVVDNLQEDLIIGPGKDGKTRPQKVKEPVR